MSRLLLVVLLFLLAGSSGCAVLATAAGAYALSQSDFVQDQIDDLD
jgi:hypothetical protein